jgi:hypothetical protein
MDADVPDDSLPDARETTAARTHPSPQGCQSLQGCQLID